MKIVVDTNLIFSSLLSKSSRIRDIFFESNNQFYCPNFVFVELFKHKEKILKYCKLSEDEFYRYLNGILNRIHFITIDFISIQNRLSAYDLCHDIDVKDTPFVALAIELDADLWSSDKKLKNGLKDKGFTRLFSISKETES